MPAPQRPRNSGETIAAARLAEGGRRFLYPFFFCLVPVLFLYLRNIREVTAYQALWALAASLGIALAGWLVTRIFAEALEKRALLLFLFLVLFHFYGLYFEQVSGMLPQRSSPVAAHALAFILPGAVWILLSVLVIRSRRIFSVLGRCLNFAVLLMLAWNLAGIIMTHGGGAGSAPGKYPADRAGVVQAPGSMPDIYCLVLDEFMAVETARSFFGHDNSGLQAALRGQGFFVAAASRSRFTLTEPAIADILNLGKYPATADPFPLVRRNAVAAFLKKRGYRVIEFACLPPLFMAAADQRFYYDLSHASIFFDDFYRVLFERSLLRILPELWSREKTDLSRFYRQRVLQVFSKLPGVVREPGPKFVFVHLFSPHEPFVFDAQGGAGDPGHIWDHSDPRFYLQQYDFISRRAAETAVMIIRNSPAPPVILIQSDHGYRGSRRPGKESGPIPHEDMLTVFNAVYLPGVSLQGIDPALPPRNNFRLVFNAYFGTHYPLLRAP